MARDRWYCRIRIATNGLRDGGDPLGATPDQTLRGLAGSQPVCEPDCDADSWLTHESREGTAGAVGVRRLVSGISSPRSGDSWHELLSCPNVLGREAEPPPVHSSGGGPARRRCKPNTDIRKATVPDLPSTRLAGISPNGTDDSALDSRWHREDRRSALYPPLLFSGWSSDSCVPSRTDAVFLTTSVHLHGANTGLRGAHTGSLLQSVETARETRYRY